MCKYMICSTNQNGVVNGKKLFLLVFCWFFWAAWPDICTTHASMTKRWEEEERQAGKEFFFLMLGNHKNWGDIVKNGWSFPFLSKADFSLNSRSNFALVFKFYSANVNIISCLNEDILFLLDESTPSFLLDCLKGK